MKSDFIDKCDYPMARRLLVWATRRMLKTHKPTMVQADINNTLLKEYRKQNGKFIASILVTVWKRREYQFEEVNCSFDCTTTEGKRIANRMLKSGTNIVNGTVSRVKNVL